jgi:hypothetical protein
MKNVIKKSLQALLLVPVIALGISVVVPQPALAACNTTATGGLQAGADCAKGTGQQPELFGSNGAFTRITNVMLYVIGAISVIMLIIGGIRYVLSGGDSGAVTNAKNTILYAVVGIIVAILAYAIVNFVISNFSAR